jgi:hypoxanthine phosphoribosyltransferase
MANLFGVEGNLKVVFTAEQIGERVRAIARQVSEDYRDRAICAVCVMENGFVFMADLIRHIERPVVCQFIRSDFTQQGAATEIFFSPEKKVEGYDVLLVEGVIQTGVTTEFLIHNLQVRGAKSVKVAALLDRQIERNVEVLPDYVGFHFDGPLVVGYGLGSPQFGRNLPYIASIERSSAAAGK